MEYLSLEEKEKILNKPYLSAKDLQKLMYPMSRPTAVRHINMIQDEMREKGFYIPNTRTHLALTKLIRKRFGI